MAETGFEIGDLIENRYRVLDVIGTGGMGTLYRVADEAREGRAVAIKTVRLDAPAAETPERVEHLQREFQILTQLAHPNLVDVHDFGVTVEGDLYFTMEWVEGRDLEPSRRPLGPEATIPVMVQVCRALGYLHAREVIHGDLKPQNVLMAGDEVKLVDFGVALEVRSPEVRARYYTPGYSAPEVREPGPIDHRADLYSLGAMWYALLVGEPPTFIFGAEQLIGLMLEEVLERQEEVPAEIGAVIARLLAVSPADRYASANEVIAAVNEVTGSTYALETQETAASYALRVHFVNRETEIEVLQTMWQQAQMDEGKLVLVSGESGVGKTRLVEELEVQAELEGAWVVWGLCVERGGSAYHPWREVLRVLMRYVEGASGAGLEMAQVGPVLAVVLPELWEREYMADLAPPAELDPQAAQQRLNNAIAQVLRAAAGLRPTIVMIEDAHWADEASLALLEFLTRIPGQAGLLMCVTYRSDEIGPEHPLVALAGDRVQRVQVHRLSPEITTDLARSMLGLEQLPALLTERLQQTTGGNAFFVQELIRSLAAEGQVLRRTVEGWQVDGQALRETQLPESIRQVVWRRLEQLSAEGRQVLTWAAVMGVVFWEKGLAEVGQVAWQRVWVALREGLEQGLVVERDESAFAGDREYLFNSPIVQEVTYGSIPQEERREVHGRVAAWLLARSEEEVSEHLGLIGDQLERAGQTEQAVAYLRQAGEQAAAQFANAEAISYLSRALELTPADERAGRYVLLLAREKVYDLQGAREAQRQDLAGLQELAEALDDDTQPRAVGSRRAEVSLRQAHYGTVTGDYPAAIAAAQKAIGLAQAVQDVSKEAAGYVQWGQVLRRQGNYEAARLRVEQALALAQEAHLRQVAINSLREIGNTFYFQGDYARAVTYYEQSLRIACEIDSLHLKSMAFVNLGLVSTALGDYDRAREYSEQALPILRELGDRFNESVALDILSYLLHKTGHNEMAHEYGRQALCSMKEIGAYSTEDHALISLGRALEGLRRLAEAADAYKQALILRREWGRSNLEMEALAGLARVSLAQEDLTRAQAQVEEILTYLETSTLDGTDEPFRIHLTCYHVLRANQDPRAQDVLNEAHRLLQERAAIISDEELRRTFLTNVAAHREILEEFLKKE